MFRLSHLFVLRRGLPIVALTAVCALALSACGNTKYAGITKLPQINTAAISLPEVQSNGSLAPFTLKAKTGELLALYFGYTNCPDLCPTTLSDLSSARSQLGKNASRVSVAFATVDLPHDTPAVMASYLQRFNFGTNGHALIPSDDNQLATATKAVFASADASNGAVGHTAWTYVINDQGAVIDELDYGTTAKQMASDLRMLLEKQST